MTLHYDLDEPYESIDPGDRDRHVLADAHPGDGLAHGWHSLRLCWDRRDAIRTYARLGLHPILLHGVRAEGVCTCRRGITCDAPAKHPVLGAWQTAPLDLDALDRMLVSDWRKNVGLRMGVQPNGERLIALDVDGDRSLLAPLEAKHGPLPPTLTAQTARGMHLIYRVPHNLKIGNRVRLAPGVDVRADGGQIVAFPSKHITGAEYRWIDTRPPEDLPV